MQFPLKVVSRSAGIHGGDLALTDYAGVVNVDIRLDVTTKRSTLNYRFAHPDKMLPGTLLPALRFLSGIHSGAALIVLVNGQAAGPAASAPQALPPELVGYTRLATDLDDIQRTSGVFFPMPTSLSGDEQDNILIAAQLLAGDTVRAEWTSWKMTLPAKSLVGLTELAAGEARQLWTTSPYILSLEGQDYPLGYILRTHAAAKVERWPALSAETQPDADIEITLVPGSDNTVTMKLVNPKEFEATQVDGSTAES